MHRHFHLLLSIALSLALAAYWLPRLLGGGPAAAGPSVGADTYRARVVAIVEEGEVDLGGLVQAYQVLRVQVTEGPFVESTFEIDYGRRQLRPPGRLLAVGEPLLVTITRGPGQLPEAFFVDFVRTPPLAWLLAAFVGASLLISGWKGLRSLLAMLVSLTLIVGYLVPQLLAGADAVRVSVVAAFAILASTLYLVYGWTLKTHAAVLGTLIALLLTGLLAGVFVDQARLTGFGSEAAMFLGQQSAVNLRGLVLGGILIGALGVLDDLVITQASAIFELRATDPTLSLAGLFRRGMRIGQDHVAATVNTLVLAYAGAALPLLLLVTLAGEGWLNFVNREAVAEEVVRTLVGSLGLISAVPLTTALAGVLATRQARLPAWLGPGALADEHAGHHHAH